MYDLTSLLSTIAGCSGTFIAIVGGFIARKLISISQERHALEAELMETEEDIKDKTAQIAAFTARYPLNDCAPDGLRPSEGDFDREQRERIDERNEWIAKIERRRFQKRLLTQRMENLKNPHGMKMSLLVFVVFSVFGVLIPMTLMPFQTENFSHFIMTKVTVILLFAGCLAYAYRYFLYLLRWKNKEVIERWREYVHGESKREKSLK